MTQQLAFDLPYIEGLGVEDFHLSLFNQAAFRVVSNWPNWPDPVVVLVGPEGCGKSHLAAIWAQKTAATILCADDLHFENIPNIATSKALILEDMDRLAKKTDDSAFFHLLNLVRQSGGHLMITARTRPDEWEIVTPDLLSRLRLAPMVEIAPPDDALFRVLIAKLLHDRQLLVEPNVIEYLMLRIERSFASARTIVAALDRHSLEKSRPITRSFAAEILNLMHTEVD
jgi:chromosomal replication initiation ATPase DnaA